MSPDLARSARTMLFVPGHRQDRFDKAADSGADAIILDLEDAVADHAKDTARNHVDNWLESERPAVVRINPAGTPWHEHDLTMLRRHPASVVMVPKAEDPAQLHHITTRLPGMRLIPLIETAHGVLSAREVCSANAVVRAAFGSIDLAAQLGVDGTNQKALAHARSQLVLFSAAAGMAAPLDGVTLAIDDEEALTADAVHALELGFGGKLCIHPRQLPTVETIFRPTPEMVEWAQRAVTAVRKSSVAVLDGKMVDKPVIARAHRILEQAATFTTSAQDEPEEEIQGA